MTAKVVSRVHPVNLMNADSAPPTLRPHRAQTKPVDLGCESAGRLSPSISLSPFVIITQPESGYSFYFPTEGAG